MISITKYEKEKFDNEGYVVKRKVIDDETINKSRLAIDKIRKKCENYEYLYYRKFADIALNDIMVLSTFSILKSLTKIFCHSLKVEWLKIVNNY